MRDLDQGSELTIQGTEFLFGQYSCKAKCFHYTFLDGWSCKRVKVLISKTVRVAQQLLAGPGGGGGRQENGRDTVCTDGWESLVRKLNSGIKGLVWSMGFQTLKRNGKQRELLGNG